MSQIYVIAGPPGIGKTTTGLNYIDPELDILNEDEIRFKYQELGYPDFREHAIHRVDQTIRTKLIRNEDFAYELNLGFPEHYDYVNSFKKFNSDNILNVILYFTDDLELCLDRAKLRHEAGRHLVKPETVVTMYRQTIPLLKENFNRIDSLTLIDTSTEKVSLVAKYDREENKLYLFNDKCRWFNDELQSFILQANDRDSNNGRDIDMDQGFTR